MKKFLIVFVYLILINTVLVNAVSFSDPIKIDNLFNCKIHNIIKSGNQLKWIKCSGTHVSIQGSGSNKFYYYSFYAESGSTIIFDIDNGIKKGSKNTDIKLILWDSKGTALGGNDNLSDYSWYTPSSPGIDPGSIDPKDSYFEWKINKSGIYIIGVGTAKSIQENNGFKESGPGLNPHDSFILNIAVN